MYRDIKSGKIAALSPDFLLIEIANVLIRKKRERPRLVEDFVERLRSSGIVFRPFDRDDIGKLISLTEKFKLSSYDSLYVILAQTEHCHLVTDDRKLLNLKSIGVSLSELYRLN